MSKSTVKFLKVRDVKSPLRGTPEAAGIDFFVPNYNDQFEKDFVDKNPAIRYEVNNENAGMKMWLAPGERVLIPSGIHTWMEPGTALIAANKSGVATKKGLIFGAQVVDSDYAGEVHISVINTSKYDIYIETGDKLIQFIHTPVLLSSIDEVDKASYDFLHDKSQRGAGGFGSTGTK
jgi:dUTP pyrophosphatase